MDRVEAENQDMISDRSEIRNVRVRIELPAFKNVIRNLYLAIKNGETLLGDKVTSIHKLLLELHCRDVTHRVVILKVLMEVIALPANDKNVSTFAVLVGSCVADDETSFVIRVEEETRAQGESVCPGQLGKIIVVDVVFILIINRAEKGVTKSLKSSRIEDRKVRAECGSLIKDDRGNGFIFGFLADEVDYAGNRPAAVKSCRWTFDYLHLFQVERKYVQQTDAARKTSERWKAVFQKLGVSSVESLYADALRG